MTDLHRLSLSEAAAKLKSGELGAVALTDHMLARIDARDSALGAYVTVLADEARETAAALDQRRARGDPLGPLHGVPIALKDLLATEGVVTTCGTRVLADWVPDYDATVVAKLEHAGAVVLGKVKLTEGAYSTHHPDISAPKNPWDADRWTGVSSSGSGVAVAGALAFGALGSDTGGSIRFPSAACGLVGLKPTYGRVSRHGAFPLAESLDHIGPMTRTVEDAARMLAVIAGFDARDPNSLNAPVPDYAGDGLTRLDGVRVGVDRSYAETGIDPRVVTTFTSAVDLLRDLGAEIVEVTLPEHRMLVANWALTCGVECALAHVDTYPDRAEDYGPDLKQLIDIGRAATAMEYALLERERERFRAELSALLHEVEFVAAPTMVMPTPTLAGLADGSAAESAGAEFITFTAPFDYSGHPTLTLPVGLDDQGMPTSFQLIGGYLSEGRLIAAGRAFEAAAGFDAIPDE